MELENHKLLQVGDEIRFNRVGAYTMTLTPLFIRYWPDVYVENDYGIRIVREKFDVKKLI
jgi:diaminopimelate decarboxylase